MSTSTAIREVRFGDSFALDGRHPQPKFWVWGCKWPSGGACQVILAAYADPADKRTVPIDEVLSSYTQVATNDCPTATVAWRPDWVSAGGGAVDDSLSRIWDRVQEGSVNA